MDMEPVPGYKFASWEAGYGDIHLVPDMRTLRVASWYYSALHIQFYNISFFFMASLYYNTGPGGGNPTYYRVSSSKSDALKTPCR